MPIEASFSIPLEYIDGVRRTNTTLDVLLESRIDDDWDVDGGGELSEMWTGFTQFTILSGKTLQMDRHGLSRRLTKKIKQPQGPIILWLEIWSSMSKAAQHEEKQHCAMEKRKLDMLDN